MDFRAEIAEHEQKIRVVGTLTGLYVLMHLIAAVCVTLYMAPGVARILIAAACAIRAGCLTHMLVEGILHRRQMISWLEQQLHSRG